MRLWVWCFVLVIYSEAFGKQLSLVKKSTFVEKTHDGATTRSNIPKRIKRAVPWRSIPLAYNPITYYPYYTALSPMYPMSPSYVPYRALIDWSDVPLQHVPSNPYQPYAPPKLDYNPYHGISVPKPDYTGGWSEWSQCSIGCGYGGTRRRYTDGLKRENKAQCWDALCKEKKPLPLCDWPKCRTKKCCQSQLCDLPKCPDLSWIKDKNTIQLNHKGFNELESEIKEMTQCQDCRQCDPKCKPCKCHMEILPYIIFLRFRDSNHPTPEEFKQIKGITYAGPYDLAMIQIAGNTFSI